MLIINRVKLIFYFVFRFFNIPMSVLPTVRSSAEIYGKLVRHASM